MTFTVGLGSLEVIGESYNIVNSSAQLTCSQRMGEACDRHPAFGHLGSLLTTRASFTPEYAKPSHSKDPVTLNRELNQINLH